MLTKMCQFIESCVHESRLDNRVKVTLLVGMIGPKMIIQPFLHPHTKWSITPPFRISPDTLPFFYYLQLSFTSLFLILAPPCGNVESVDCVLSVPSLWARCQQRRGRPTRTGATSSLSSPSSASAYPSTPSSPMQVISSQFFCRSEQYRYLLAVTFLFK